MSFFCSSGVMLFCWKWKGMLVSSTTIGRFILSCFSNTPLSTRVLLQYLLPCMLFIINIISQCLTAINNPDYATRMLKPTQQNQVGEQHSSQQPKQFCGIHLQYNYLNSNLKMRPNVTMTTQGTINNTHHFTEKLLPHTPTHKSQEPMSAIKKIQNFSYALNDEIGLGLTSKVFKGKNDITGAPVAIKCIDLKSQGDHLNQEFIKQEIATLEKIRAQKASYLLKLESVVLTSNNLYIVTEFCEGKDMGKILRQKKLLSEQQAQSVMRQMILGYRELYSMGFIHRDLKLSNLFVTNNRVKIADFGFAISQQKCNYSFPYNAGSPKYMPPESLKYNRYSFKTDVWSMGVIAYELVYGHAPWQSMDDAKLYDMTTTTPIENLFDKNISVTDHYKTFIVNCLQVNAGQRAGPDFVFNYSWPQAQDYIEGFVEEKKVPEVIKVPGKNYAVFNSANQISYESKQLDVWDFVNNNSIPTQFILLSQLNTCRFLIGIIKGLKVIDKGNSQLIATVSQQIALTVQIMMKGLGEVTCMQKNRYDAPNFDAYIKTGDWQNLKQLIIRYDIEFRQLLKGSQPARKNSVIPQTNALPQLISHLKQGLPENTQLLDNLITLYEVRAILTSSTPLEFAEKVNMAAVAKEALLPEQMVAGQVLLNRVSQRLIKVGL